MCGICGIVPRPGRGRAPDLDLLKRMLGRLAHRGPDGNGHFRDRTTALGHVRLSVIDLEGGVQPLSNEDESVWVTFNGEIFNYVELRRELVALGHVMHTRSDTEVIVHAWEEWGGECFERFNGQWAIGIWDVRRRTLVLSRDRLGIRPLYYTAGGERFLFASEVKALFADPSVPRYLDPAGLAEVFSFWCPVAPRTVFGGVQEVQPGHYLELDVDSFSLTDRAYWSIRFPQIDEVNERSMASSFADEAQRLMSTLSEASRLRFTRSDVPVGSYLSGGLDSSVTTAVVAGETGAPLSTFSLAFADSEFDESSFQRTMVERLGTRHHEVAVTGADIASVFPDVVWHAERPLLRAAPCPLFLLSKLVRDSGYKVVVTGEGSDEVLSGYDIFRELKVRLFLARHPDSPMASAVLQRLYPWMARAPGNAPAFARAFFSGNTDPEDPGVSHRPRWSTTRALRALLASELHEQVSACPVEDELLSRLPKEHTRWDPVARAQWLEMTTLLPGYILSAQGDRMLMAHSVEGRFPFLDHRLIEYAGALPMHMKLFGLDEKHLLKEACSGQVPQEILKRPKQPYRAPDAASFFGSDHPSWIDDLLSPESVRQAGIFRPQAIEKLLEKCRRVSGVGMSNSDNMRVVGVLSSMLLHRQFIAGDGENAVHPGPTAAMERI